MLNRTYTAQSNIHWSEDFHGSAARTVTALAQPYDGQGFRGPIALGPWSVVVLSRR